MNSLKSKKPGATKFAHALVMLDTQNKTKPIPSRTRCLAAQVVTTATAPKAISLKYKYEPV